MRVFLHAFEGASANFDAAVSHFNALQVWFHARDGGLHGVAAFVNFTVGFAGNGARSRHSKKGRKKLNNNSFKTLAKWLKLSSGQENCPKRKGKFLKNYSPISVPVVEFFSGSVKAGGGVGCGALSGILLEKNLNISNKTRPTISYKSQKTLKS